MPTIDVLEPTIADAIEAVSEPRQAPADSFVLHAPLELMARIGLLDRLPSNARPPVVDRIAATAEAYRATGPGAGPAAPGPYASASHAARGLDDALRTGDVEAADAATCWLAANVTAARLPTLVGGAVIDSLAAAGHAPIGLNLLVRVRHGTLPPTLLRGPLRELARHPTWRLRWFREDVAPSPRVEDLATRLAAIAHLGSPGSGFIHPLMSQAEASGVARAAVGGSLGDRPDEVASVLTRAAAWSMLNDDPGQAPYGWTHCLTLPQAVMSLADEPGLARTAIAVAGTHVAGFRAAHATMPLGRLDDDATAPDDVDIDAVVAAAAVHPDAHLAKYALACLHAAEADPPWRGTYHHAAAHLVAWWQRHDRSAGSTDERELRPGRER